MIDMLRYNVEDDGIRIDVPQPAFDAALENATDFEQIINHPLAKQFVEADQHDGGTSLLLNTRRLGSIKDDWVQNDRARAMTYVATMAAAFTDTSQRDPDVQFVNMSLNPIGDGSRYGMDAAINRWIAPYHEAQAATTQAMGRTALNLGYAKPRQLNGMVYAHVDTERGVTLQTNPIASSSLDIDGNEYSAESPTVMLYGHNVYNRQMQLILLSGVIALAKS